MIGELANLSGGGGTMIGELLAVILSGGGGTMIGELA
jgi:hypothetical protein